MAGRNYSRKDSPALADLPLIWDSANSDWRLTTLQAILDLFNASGASASAPLIDFEAVLDANNPTPERGQLAIALDMGYFKIGDGATAWGSLTPRYESDELVMPIIDLEATLVSTNPIAEAGQLVVASDAGYFKIGDGVTAFNSIVDFYNADVSSNDDSWTEETSLENSWTGTIRYIRRSGFVTVVVDAVDGSTKSTDTMLTLPLGYRPTVTIRSGLSTDAGTFATLSVNSDGEISSDGTAADLRGQIIFPLV